MLERITMTYRISIACSMLLLAMGASARGEDLVDNPKYQSWSTFPVGTSITGHTNTKMGAQSMTMELKQKLIEKTAEKLTLEVLSSFQGTAHTEKQEVAAKVPQSKAVKEDELPQGVTGKAEKQPDEQVKIGDKSYTCKVMSFSGEMHGSKASGKTWTSNQVPGGLVKSEMHMEGKITADNSTAMTSIDVPAARK